MNQGFTQGQQQNVRQTQEHILAPHQLQSLDILAAPLQELEAKLLAEKELNPVLELDENTDFTEEPATQEFADPLDENREDFQETLERAVSDGTDFFQTGGDQDDHGRQQFFESIASEVSLQEQLLEQLRLSDCPPALLPVAEEIIGSIGENGYFESAPAEIAQICGCTVQDAEEMLSLIQTFDPPGIGARDLKECLLLQIRRNPAQYPPRLGELVQNHLEDIGRNRLPQTAKAMSLSLKEVSELVSHLRKLNPHPGLSAAPVSNAVYIRPEIIVRKDRASGEYQVIPARDAMPRLILSNRYLEMLEDPATPEDVKEYIRGKIASAKNLMFSLEQRRTTIQRIAELIVSAQFDFFEQGREALRPMTMREIADKIGRDESTVSRAIAGKYMETPRGTVAFRDFFGGGFRSESGDEVSAHGIREIIRDAVADENPASPLSDSKIESLLKEKGFTVARRTIAKYREELGIPSSQMRKVYTS